MLTFTAFASLDRKSFADAMYLLVVQFFLTSDDGSLLYLNEVLVVNNDFYHGMLEVAGSAFLYAGDYVPFRVDYFQGDGGFGLELRWQGPGISKQIVPASAFFIGQENGTRFRLF